MGSSIRPAIDRGRQYAFPVVWAAVFATGVGLSEPLPSFDAAPYLSFVPIGKAQASSPDEVTMAAMDPEPPAGASRCRAWFNALSTMSCGLISGALLKIDPESGNIRLVLNWCLESDQPRPGSAFRTHGFAVLAWTG